MADFAAIKERVSIEQAAEMVGLEMKNMGNQLRGPCPTCKTGGERALVITPAKAVFYCFSAGIGGDLITLVGHIQKCSLADAGRHISDHFRIGNKSTSETSAPVHQSPTLPEDQKAALQPLTYLVADHPAVEAVGFDQATAEALGIGFAPKGLMKGTVAIPVRNEDGSIAGYVGITEAKLPPKFFINNIVPFAKKTA